MKRISTYLVEKRKIFFFITLLLLVVCTLFSSLPTFTGKLLGFDLQQNSYYKTLFKMDSSYGSPNTIYIKITPANDDIGPVFSGVQELEQKIKDNFPEVNLISPRQFYYRLFYNKDPEHRSLSGFLNKAAALPLLSDLISNDKRSFLLLLTSDPKKVINIEKLDSITHSHYNGINAVSSISFAHVEHAVAKYIRKDLLTLSSIIIIIFLLFFMYTFRRPGAIIFTSIVILLASFSSLFYFSIFHFQFNIVTILVIPVVLVLSLSDSIHLLTGYASLKDIDNKAERLTKVVDHYIVPSFFSSATTAAALFTFYIFNDSEFIRQFGLVTACCLMTEFFLVFFIAPYLLELTNINYVNNKKINFIGEFLSKYKRLFAYTFVSIFIASLFFMQKLSFNSTTEIFFPQDSELERTHKNFNANFYSQMKLDVLVEGTGKNPVDTLAYSTALIHSMDSIANVLRKIKGVVHVGSPADTYFIEASNGITINYLESLGNKDPFHNKKKNNYRMEIKVNDAQVIKDLTSTVFPGIIRNYSSVMKMELTSPVLIMDFINKKVSASLVNSLLTSGASIILMIFLLTRSISITIASLLPNLVPLSFIVFIYLLLGLQINILTAITAVVCLGLLDDDTIHILYRKLWLKEPLEELSFSILSTSILLAAGFGMFYFSSFKPTQVFGIVSALIFLFGVICELTLMPWIIDSWMIKMDRKK